MIRITLLVSCLCSIWTAVAIAADDVLIADFEQDTYGAWTVEGKAFGPGPAAGTLPGQMPVSGFEGERLVNSFFQGDGTTGTLTSPEFQLERDYLTFLIGGGGYEGRTCINLLVDGDVVRTAVGPNTRAGGSEELALYVWDVAELDGKWAAIQIVDNATGGWGHINVDQIVLTDEKPDVPIYQPLEATFTVEDRYLVVPIKNGAAKTSLTLEIDGTIVRKYDTELATDPDDVDWYAFFTIEVYGGKPARVSVARGTEAGFGLVRQADEVPGAADWYTEELRPQFHFSQAVGWNNDPNGMVYLDGEWHLFFQHNPVGWNWGNMTWGHAVSTDLVHWKQLPNALFPETMARGACFSGGGLVDRRNIAGWKTGEDDVLVAFLTDTGAGESVAYSNDRGRTFTWYEGNPVVKHRGRDPFVIWYAYTAGDEPLNERAAQLGGHWVMAVYDEHDEFDRNIAFYTSVDLKQWQEQSHLPGYFECPALFKAAVDGEAARTRWVVFAADAKYALGEFDGRTFTPHQEVKHQMHWGAYYASQIFSNAPDGRHIQIGWVRIATPGMPFNQTFSFPHELTLRTTEEGIRMFAEPVAEIEQLSARSQSLADRQLLDGQSAGLDVSGDLFDIQATFDVGAAETVGLDVGGERIEYNVLTQELRGARLHPIDGRVTIRVLVDRPMLEIIGNDGRVSITNPREHRGDVSRVQAFATGGRARLLRLDAHELESIWQADR